MGPKYGGKIAEMAEVGFVTRVPHGVTLGIMQMVSVIALGIHLPAVSDMASSFGVSAGQVSATMSGYLIIGAILQLCCGTVSDFLGRRLFTLVSLSGFIFASVGCALATDLASFQFFRMCQGIAMVLTILSRAMVADSRDEDAAGSLLGYIASGMAVVTILSPITGGILVSGFGWQAPFWVSAVFGASALMICWTALPETIAPRAITSKGLWSDYRKVLSSRRFLGYALGIACSLATYYVFLVAAPVIGIGDQANQALLGAFLSLMTVGFLFGSFLSGRMVTRLGVFAAAMIGRLVAITGLVVGLVLLAVAPQAAMWLLIVPVMLAGMGDGITVPAATGAMLTSKGLPTGTGAALSGVGILGFGALVSLVVGHIATASLDIAGMLLLMLVPASAAAAPLVFGSLAEKE